MMTVRAADERGQADFGWLKARHSFSFGHYHHPDHMGFGALRVINEDRIAPGGGFDTHGHPDMEIITYILDGALEHRDSLGNGSVLRAGEVQRMSAGTGIRHSEFNHSQTAPVHLLQIWLEPGRLGLRPGYEQKPFPAEARRGRLCLLAAPDARDGALTLHQDAELHGALLAPGERVTHTLADGRRVWLQVARGELEVDGQRLVAGDGAAVSGQPGLTVVATGVSEFLLFDLA